MRIGPALGLGLALVAAAWLVVPHREELSPADARIEGLRAALVERETAGESWSARWRVCWRPVPGAAGYAVTVASSEGVDPVARRVDSACWSVTVATGVPRRREVGRQLALLAPQLSVRVAAVLADGRAGPPSADLAVGVPYP